MTIKYLRLSMILIFIFSLVFSIIYIVQIIKIDSSLSNISITNLYLLQTSLWTTEIVSSFISLKFFLDIKLGLIDVNVSNINYMPLIEFDDYQKGLKENIDSLYEDLITHLGEIEMKIPNFLSNEELNSLYWDYIKVSYVDKSFLRNNKVNNETYPSAMDQFLCNCKRFLKINSSETNISNIQSNFSFESFYNYTTYLIIENGYNSLIPEQLKKLRKMSNIFSEYNNKRKIILIAAIAVFAGCSALAMILFILMIRVNDKIIKKS